jgi:hypothetical protein
VQALQLQRVKQQRYTRLPQPVFGMAFPCVNKFMLQPSFKYLAESAILSRLSVAVARPWMNRPSNVTDPKLNIDQKRQGFLERAMVELFGTPAYMTVMHLTQDLMGNLLHKMGVFTPQLHVPNLSPQLLERANQTLTAQIGHRGLWGKIIFDAKSVSLTTYLSNLDKVGLSVLKEHPQFMHVTEAWFRRTKLATSATVLSGIIASALFGGVIIQKINDQWFAPLIAKFLKNHEAVHLSDTDLTLKV